MTLAIHTRVTGQNLQFNYQDAVVEGDYVFLGRVQGAMAEVWLRCNVDSEATEGDWIYVVRQDGSRLQTRRFYGYVPRGTP
jgi:hypothetical protein